MENFLKYFISKHFGEIIGHDFSSISSFEALKSKLEPYRIQCTYFDIKEIGKSNIPFPFIFFNNSDRTFSIINKLTKHNAYLNVPKTNFFILYKRDAFIAENDGTAIVLLDSNFKIKRPFHFPLFFSQSIFLLAFILLSLAIRNLFIDEILTCLLIAMTSFDITQYIINRRFDNSSISICKTLLSDCGINKNDTLFKEINVPRTALFAIAFITLIFLGELFNPNASFEIILMLLTNLGLAVTGILFIYNFFIKSKVCLQCFTIHLLLFALFFTFYNIFYQKWGLLTFSEFQAHTIHVIFFLLSTLFAFGYHKLLDAISLSRSVKVRSDAINQVNSNFGLLSETKKSAIVQHLLHLNSTSNNEACFESYHVIFFDADCGLCFDEALGHVESLSKLVNRNEILFAPVFANSIDPSQQVTYKKLKNQFAEANYPTFLVNQDLLKNNQISSEFSNYTDDLNEFVNFLNIRSYPIYYGNGRFYK